MITSLLTSGVLILSSVSLPTVNHPIENETLLISQARYPQKEYYTLEDAVHVLEQFDGDIKVLIPFGSENFAAVQTGRFWRDLTIRDLILILQWQPENANELFDMLPLRVRSYLGVSLGKTNVQLQQLQAIILSSIFNQTLHLEDATLKIKPQENTPKVKVVRAFD